jgi:hypothetical protein
MMNKVIAPQAASTHTHISLQMGPALDPPIEGVPLKSGVSGSGEALSQVI